MLHHGKMNMSILVNKHVYMLIIELLLIFQDIMHFKMFSTFVIFLKYVHTLSSKCTLSIRLYMYTRNNFLYYTIYLFKYVKVHLRWWCTSSLVYTNMMYIQHEDDVHKTSQVYNTLDNKKTTIQNQVSFFINS